MLLCLATLLGGCDWIDVERVACASSADCVYGSVCVDATWQAPGHCSQGGGDDDDDDDAPIETGPVSGLDLVGLSLNQGVELRLLDGTDWIDNRNVDVVAGRPGILRLFVEPQEEWAPRPVRATVEFDDGRVVTVDEAVGNGGSDATDLGSTINIELAGEDIVPAVGFSVRLQEVDYDTDDDGGIVPYEGTQEATRWPRAEDEFEDLRARSSGVLDLRLVPVRYNADGSGRLPDTSESAVAIIRERMIAMYPATEIRVTVESPMDWGWSVPANGAGWSELLQEVYYLRDQRNMPGNSYTYGLFAPSPDRWTYCAVGCVAGLSIQVEQASYSDSRVSIGLGYGDVDTAETMAHEVGHAHGRGHAPCGGVNSVDPAFPYANARLGVVGYDIVEGNLKNPEAYADMMAYCDPIWVSDYTWEALHQRIRAVGPEEQLVGQPDVAETMSVIVDANGLRSPRRQPGNLRFRAGDATARFFNADGFQIDEGTARFLPFDHIDGGLLVLPAPPEGATAIDVPGYGALTL